MLKRIAFVFLISISSIVGFAQDITKESLEKSYDFVSKKKDGRYAIVKNGKWGYADAQGRVIIPLTFDYISSMEDGQGFAYAGNELKLIDDNGKVIYNSPDMNYSFTGNKCWIKVPSESGMGYKLVDNTGKDISGKVYTEVFDFDKGKAQVRASEGLYHFIDDKGKLAFPVFSEQTMDFIEGISVFILDNKVGFFNESGKVVIPPTYEATLSDNYPVTYYFSEGVAPVAISDSSKMDTEYYPTTKYGYIDQTGKVQLPFKYSAAAPFLGGLAAAADADKWGFIDRQGKVVAEMLYDELYPFDNGLAIGVTTLNEMQKLSFIDTKGKVVKELTVKSFTVPLSNPGFVIVSNKKDKYAVIDRTAKVILPYEYSAIDAVGNKFFNIQKNGKTGLADSKGKVIVPATYNTGSYFFAEGGCDDMSWIYTADTSQFGQLKYRMILFDDKGRKVPTASAIEDQLNITPAAEPVVDTAAYPSDEEGNNVTVEAYDESVIGSYIISSNCTSIKKLDLKSDSTFVYEFIDYDEQRKIKKQRKVNGEWTFETAKSVVVLSSYNRRPQKAFELIKAEKLPKKDVSIKVTDKLGKPVKGVSCVIRGDMKQEGKTNDKGELALKEQYIVEFFLSLKEGETAEDYNVPLEGNNFVFKQVIDPEAVYFDKTELGFSYGVLNDFEGYDNFTKVKK